MDCYFKDIEHHIAKHIFLSRHRLLIAVAWFTNESLAKAIIRKADMDIEIIVDDNKINRGSKALQSLQSASIDVVFIENLASNTLMHNKFCVIDNHVVITGSYNWTQRANFNEENIAVFKDVETATIYTHEFRRLKELEFANDRITISQEEHNEIINIIYKELVKLLKTNVVGLPSGLFANWKNERIKNKIRVLNERVRNTINKQFSDNWMYQDLIQRYGLLYESKASDEEKAYARDLFMKNGLHEWNTSIEREFATCKLKAIKRLQEDYAQLLKLHAADKNKLERLIRIHQFFGREKHRLSKATGIHIFN